MRKKKIISETQRKGEDQGRNEGREREEVIVNGKKEKENETNAQRKYQ